MKQGSVLIKLVKLAVASAVLFGASAAIAECSNEDTLGLTGIENECCVYDYNENIVTGYLLDYNNTIGDDNTTIKCQFKEPKEKGKKEDRPANIVRSTDEDHMGELCNTLAADTTTVVTGVWTNVVSSVGITSLVCKYSPPPSTGTGTAYYIDSLVSGVYYTCGSVGSITGVTGEDGSFTFEVGESCTFYLGEIELRNVDSGLLEDGKGVYESDVEIARILQSLDSDGDPDNGITISATTIQALADEGITTLPDTPEEIDAMLVAAGAETVVSEKDAATHMLTTLIVGQTYYATACEPANHVDTLAFSADGSMLTIEGDGTETRNWTYSIDGAVLSLITNDDAIITFTNIRREVDYLFFNEGGNFYTGYDTAAAALNSSCTP